MKCLVTKLQEVVNNDNLPVLNVVVLTITGTVNGQIRGTSNSDPKVMFDAKNVIVASGGVPITDNTIPYAPVEFSLEGASEGKVFLYPYENMKIITVPYQNNAALDIEQLGNCINLESLNIRETGATGSLSTMADKLYSNGKRSGSIVCVTNNKVSYMKDGIKTVCENGNNLTITFSNSGYTIVEV